MECDPNEVSPDHLERVVAILDRLNAFAEADNAVIWHEEFLRLRSELYRLVRPDESDILLT